MDAGSVTSTVSGTIRSFVPGARVTGRGINLPRAAGVCFVDEVGADAAVGSGDEDDGVIQ